MRPLKPTKQTQKGPRTKGFRNVYVKDAMAPNAGPMKHKLEPRKGAKNEQAEILSELNDEQAHGNHFEHGDIVRMTDTFKAKLAANCKPGQHTGLVVEGSGECCMQCSLQHVIEFGNEIGVVEGLTDYNNAKPNEAGYDAAKIGPELDVRWQRSGLRYMYGPDDLELVDDDNN